MGFGLSPAFFVPENGSGSADDESAKPLKGKQQRHETTSMNDPDTQENFSGCSK
jgi:hypothetical protein